MTKQTSDLRSTWLLTPGLALLVVFFVVPMLFLVCISFLKYDQVQLFLNVLTLDNYTKFFINGGSSPSYQWKVNNINAGTNSSTFTYVPAQGDNVLCVMNSDLACTSGNPAVSGSISITVIPNSPVSVTISANPPGPVCATTSVSFSAAAVNGGIAPVYHWSVNGAPAGTDSPLFQFIPIEGDVISCQLISDVGCPQGNPAVSNDIIMIENCPSLAPGLNASECWRKPNGNIPSFRLER